MSKKIVGITFEKNLKISFFETEEQYKIGTKVLVETDRGIQFGFIATKVREYEEKDVSKTTKSILKVASKKEIEQYQNNKKESKEALETAKEYAKELNLPMHFLEADYTFDRNQLFLTYLADERIDFRQLAKMLAAKYKTRIELRQIGVRDKAKKVGGIGPCGLSLCCNQFLQDFASVSINMAKNQDLALNPTKINGLCGRLLCCLNYEDEVYNELKMRMPNIGEIVNTKEGKGKVVSVHLFNQTYDVQLPNQEIIVESVH